MPSLLIIGTGRAAFHLGNAFRKASLPLNGLVGRDPSRTEELAIELGTSAYLIGEELPLADVILLAVSDDAIAAVAHALPSTETVVAHVSGAPIFGTHCTRTSTKECFGRYKHWA
ncbi:MAG: NAD(P)-binding domain-containing protein [Flavobacteriales bacterium]|nr:NAD(P)-binding domain-containing protein [Flavobacteriales bacterium]